MAGQKQDDQLEPTYSSSLRIWDVALKTCQKRWTTGRSGERGSGISMLAARHDDDDDIPVQIISIKNSYMCDGSPWHRWTFVFFPLRNPTLCFFAHSPRWCHKRQRQKKKANSLFKRLHSPTLGWMCFASDLSLALFVHLAWLSQTLANHASSWCSVAIGISN